MRIEQHTQSPALETVDHLIRKRGIEIRSSLRYENGLPFIVQRLLDVLLGCGT